MEQTSDPVGGNAPGMELAQEAQQFASSFNQAATTHQTVAVASAHGEHAKLPQNLGHVLEDSQLPHMEETNITIVGKGGVGIYGPAIQQDPQITDLLEQVRGHRLTLDQALEVMP